METRRWEYSDLSRTIRKEVSFQARVVLSADLYLSVHANHRSYQNYPKCKYLPYVNITPFTAGSRFFGNPQKTALVYGNA